MSDQYQIKLIDGVAYLVQPGEVGARLLSTVEEEIVVPEVPEELTASFPPKRETWVYKITGTSTTLQGVGMSNGASGGTPSAADDADGPFNSYSTSTTDNNATHINDTGGVYTQARRDWNSEVYIKIKTAASVADLAISFGFATGPNERTSATTSNAYWTYDTDADGTAFWRTYTGSTAGPGELQTTDLPVVADTVVEGWVKLTASAVQFYAKVAGNWVLKSTHSTDIPAATTPLGWFFRIQTRTTAAKTLKVSRINLRSDI